MIKLSKSCIGDEEKQAVLKVLDHEYLGMGAEVGNFEDLLSKSLGDSSHVYQVVRLPYILHFKLVE